MATGQIPPGWYYGEGDPPGTQRYWDGVQWTTGPMAQPPVPAPGPMPAYPQYSHPPVDRVDRSPWGWYKHVLFENYGNFKGRARRAEYWWFTLVSGLIMLVLLAPAIAMAAVAGEDGDLPPAAIPFFLVLLLYVLAVAIPAIGVMVRRLHDTNRSGAWYFISFIPYIGGFILLIFLAGEGTRGPNQYGPGQKGAFAVQGQAQPPY